MLFNKSSVLKYKTFIETFRIYFILLNRDFIYLKRLRKTRIKFPTLRYTRKQCYFFFYNFDNLVNYLSKTTI